MVISPPLIVSILLKRHIIPSIQQATIKSTEKINHSQQLSSFYQSSGVSLMAAAIRQSFKTQWNQTESYSATINSD
jgi:hypothetical protein